MATWIKIDDGPSLLDLMLSDYHRKEDSNMLFPSLDDSHRVFFSGTPRYDDGKVGAPASYGAHRRNIICFITGGDLVEAESRDDAGDFIPKGARLVRGWVNCGRSTLSRFEGWYDYRSPRRGLIKFND